MRRVAFCIFAAVIAGCGLAAVLALGTASVAAAFYKSRVPIGESVALNVQDNSSLVITVALVGFLIGSGTIVWMFLTTRDAKKDPDENSPEGRSEV